MTDLFKAIGLMSGTSLDGEIDVALIETDGHSHVKPLDFYAYPYDKGVRDKVRHCFGKTEPDAQTREAEALITNLHIDAVKTSGFKGDLIGFHGQTITHAPENKFTWQLGDGSAMAKALGIDVINDFRSADVAAGGQGAPLAPLYHAALMAGHPDPVCILNLGGVGNVTYINKSHLIAFDTGPANALMDDYMAAHCNAPYDKGGALAERGKADRAIIDAFLAHEYFKTKPPKSLDRNTFADALGALPDDPADVMATLAVASAAAVMAAVKHLPQPPHQWYMCGGGRHNAFMMQLLEDMLRPARVQAIEAAGYNGDATEAECFAYLAVRSHLGLPLSLPTTTGVAKPTSGGVWHKA